MCWGLGYGVRIRDVIALRFKRFMFNLCWWYVLNSNSTSTRTREELEFIIYFIIPINNRYFFWNNFERQILFLILYSSGFIPVIIENVLEGDELRTDISEIEKKIKELGEENIVCIMTTTSCFAPRVPDR